MIIRTFISTTFARRLIVHLYELNELYHAFYSVTLWRWTRCADISARVSAYVRIDWSDNLSVGVLLLCSNASVCISFSCIISIYICSKVAHQLRSRNFLYSLNHDSQIFNQGLTNYEQKVWWSHHTVCYFGSCRSWLLPVPATDSSLFLRMKDTMRGMINFSAVTNPPIKPITVVII